MLADSTGDAVQESAAARLVSGARAADASAPVLSFARGEDATALAQFVTALKPWLSDSRVTELCINRPEEVFVERSDGWSREAMPFATFAWCQQFAKLVAGATKQRVNAESPLLSAALPSGERVQVVLPPARRAGTVAIAIRRPSDRVWGLEELAAGGSVRAMRRRTGGGRSAGGGARAPVCGGRVGRVPAARGALEEEYRRVGSDGVGQDDAHEGAGAGDSLR